MSLIVIVLLWLAVGYTYGKFFDSQMVESDANMTDHGVLFRLILYAPIIVLSMIAIVCYGVYKKIFDGHKS